MSNSTYNDNISYRINDKQIDGECTICGENLYIYTPETFPAKKEIDYVDRHVFESLAKDVSILRTEMNEITNKDKIIDILVDKLSFHRDYTKESEDRPSNNNVLSSRNINCNETESSTEVTINNLKSENILRTQLQGKDSRISFLTQFISNINGNKGVNSDQIDLHSNTLNKSCLKNHHGETNYDSHWRCNKQKEFF